MTVLYIILSVVMQVTNNSTDSDKTLMQLCSTFTLLLMVYSKRILKFNFCSCSDAHMRLYALPFGYFKQPLHFFTTASKF